MKSISVKVRNSFFKSLLIFIAAFTVISISLLYIQNRRFIGISDEASKSLTEFTDSVINDNIKQYANDITAACGLIIDNNYVRNKNIGDAAASYLTKLYENNGNDIADTSYGVGFIEGRNNEKLSEFYKIAGIREYISSMPDYEPEDLSSMDVFVVTKSGIVIDGTASNLGDNYRDLRLDSWYIDAHNAMKPVWTDVIVGSVSGESKIDYVVPIIINGDFKGVTVVSASITEIYNTLLNIDFKGLKDIILTDSKGNRITGDGKYDINAVKSEGDIVFKDNYCMTAYKINENDSKVYFVFDIEDILLAINKTENEIAESSKNIKYYSFNIIALGIGFYIIMALLFVIIAIVYSKRISSSLVNPIMLLTKKVEGFGKGNMDISVEDISSDDEVGVLAEKFAAMSDDLKIYLSEIKEITAEQERVKTEMEAASKIQMSIMSRDFPQSDKFDVYAYMKAAKAVGGDLYTVIEVDEDHILVAVADVAGKGIPASLFSVRSKVYMQIYGEMGLKPSEILANVNNRLCQNNDEAIFVTAFLGILNTKTGEFVYANAGHNRPVITGNDTYWLNVKPGLPLGCMEDMEYIDEYITFKKNEGIFIYSDGITEAVGYNDEFYSDERLLKKLSENNIKELKSKEIIDLIIKDLDIHYNGKELWDDVTMLELKYMGKE